MTERIPVNPDPVGSTTVSRCRAGRPPIDLDQGLSRSVGRRIYGNVSATFGGEPAEDRVGLFGESLRCLGT